MVINEETAFQDCAQLLEHCQNSMDVDMTSLVEKKSRLEVFRLCEKVSSSYTEEEIIDFNGGDGVEGIPEDDDDDD